MSLYQRGNMWYFLFYVRGKRFRGSTEIEIAGKAAERAARDVEAEKRRLAREGEDLKPKRAPYLREFLETFSGWVKTINKAPKTRADYLNGCRLILATELAGVRLDKITAGDVESTKFHDSPYSTNCALRTLRRALRRAHEKEIIRRIPKIKMVDAPRRDLVVTADNEQRILAAIRHDDEHRRYKKIQPSPLADVFTIMMDGGMRDGEVVAMKVECVQFGLHYYWNPKGKTRKARRRIPLSERMIAILRSRVGDRQQGWVFPSAKSKSGHVELSGLQHRFRRIARALGIPDELKIYCARHAYGTDVMAEAMDPRLVMDAMGHEDLKTTMNYLHPDVQRVKTIIDKRNESRLVQ
jgi:integrase